MVKDINPDSASSYLQRLTAVNGVLFFTVDDGVHGTELWKSDGTEAGTVIVKDIRPGASSGGVSDLQAVGNTLFFTADDGVNGRELWKSDGTEGGTGQVKDIFAGSEASFPESLTAVNGALYFTADDGVSGRELWISDGSTAGTTLVEDLVAGAGSSYPQALTALSGRLYFQAADGAGEELWASDGRPPGPPWSKHRARAQLVESANLTGLNGNCISGPTTGLGRRGGCGLPDGTETGTVPVGDVVPGLGLEPGQLRGRRYEAVSSPRPRLTALSSGPLRDQFHTERYLHRNLPVRKRGVGTLTVTAQLSAVTTRR